MACIGPYQGFGEIYIVIWFIMLSLGITVRNNISIGISLLVKS